MAFPVILLDSAAGSDTAASGAGPSSALTGNAATTADGVTFILNAGTNLTGVATDGSHALWVNDTTAGNRNFGKITSTSGSGGATPTVVVAETFATIAVGKTWAIGGKRLSISGSSSRRLIDNNNGNGDAMPGWTIRFNNSGFTDSFAGQIRAFRSGDTTDGPITLEGLAGLGTAPVISQTDDTGPFFRISAEYWVLQHFNLKNTSGSQTATYALLTDWGGGNGGRITNMVIGANGAGFFYGLYCGTWTVAQGVESCYNQYGVYQVGTSELRGVYCHDNIADGFTMVDFEYRVVSCIAARNGGKGLNDITGAGDNMIALSVFDANTSDGVTLANLGRGQIFSNNIVSNNGGYGVSFGGTVNPADVSIMLANGNDFFNNTSGITDSSPSPFTGSQTVDPQFVNASAGDFTPQNTTLKGAAYPLTVAAATNYQWIGPIQPNATGGSTIVLPGIFGG